MRTRKTPDPEDQDGFSLWNFLITVFDADRALVSVRAGGAPALRAPLSTESDTPCGKAARGTWWPARAVAALQNPAVRHSPAILRSRLFRFGTPRRVRVSRCVLMSRARCISTCPSITLNDGRQHPQLGYGTYKVGFVPASASGSGGVATGEGNDAKDIVQAALELGYRFLDCAEFYGNEAAVGAAIAASGVPREELFLASKVWSDTLYAGRTAIREQVARSLADLRTDYLDLYLVHWPVPGKHVLAYKHLEELRAEGKIRSIGVSNYTIEDYEELMQHAIVPPAINQIEVNPFLYRKKTIEYFQSQGVAIQAYRSLFAGQGKKALSDPVVMAIAEEHGKSAAQVLGRWCVQKRLIYLPKSEKEERMIENAAVFDFELTAENVSALDALTSQDSIDAFAALYRKCVVRDTPLEATGEGVKTDVTFI